MRRRASNARRRAFPDFSTGRFDAQNAAMSMKRTFTLIRWHPRRRAGSPANFAHRHRWTLDPKRMPANAETANVRRRNRKKATFLSANQIDEQAEARVREAEHLPPGEARDSALRN